MTEKKNKKVKEEVVDAEVVETAEEQPKEEKPSISLKKAYIIENELVKLQREASLKLRKACSVTLDDSDEVESVLLEGKKELKEAYNRYNQVESFITKLRTLKGVYNTQSGINSLLCAKSVHKRIADNLTFMVKNCVPYKDLAKVQKKVRREEERSKTLDYHYNVEVEQFPLHVDEVQEYKDQLKILSKELRTIDEQIGLLNYQTRIPLSDEDVQFLQGEDLI